MLTLTPTDTEHLLGRRERHILTPGERDALRGTRALVTGAGGSVGGELARQLAASGAGRLTLVDHAEFALFEIERELRHAYPSVEIEAIIGDVSRRADMTGILRAVRPHVVYHAAAYKHVTMAERCIVPAARTNVVGTVQTLRAARQVGARFVLISSDKAVEPSSVMGATKRCAELVTLSAASPMFRPIVVRFGNVLGSSGSLVDVMWRCVHEGRNVPITDPEASRFFMTGAEAASLVLKADLTSHNPAVSWLDMGTPVRIGDLAHRFIEWATPAGQSRVGIDIVGLRPGEKLHEELPTQGLAMRLTGHPRIVCAREPDIGHAGVNAAVRGISRACVDGDASRVIDSLKAVVGGFVPSAAATKAAASQRGHRRWEERVRLSAVAVAS